MNTDNAPSQPHVVIVGAGFGGLTAARHLANQAVRVTLIDRHNYHLFQPLLYQVATAELTASEIAESVRHVLNHAENIDVYMDTVTGVKPDTRTLQTLGGIEIDFDYLILATGARHSYFGRDDWEPFAPGLKSIANAYEIRNRVLSAFEKAEMLPPGPVREARLTFVIIGGGPTGVEMAGALSELARKSLNRDFKHISPESSRIVLIDAGPRLLAAFHESLSARAESDLSDMGVEVILNTRVSQMDECSVSLGTSTLETSTIIWAAGVQASPAASWLGVEPVGNGHLPVDNYCRVDGYDHIFAIGDTASLIPDGAKRPLPGLAPVARQQGNYVAGRILDRIQGRTDSTEFRYRDFGCMATIGRNRAVVDLRGWQFSGFTGWLLWSVVHIFFLIGFRRRTKVAFSWLWNYLSSQRNVCLILDIVTRRH